MEHRNEVLEQWTDARADTLTLEQANLILNLGRSPEQLAADGELSVNSMITSRLAGIVKELDPTVPSLQAVTSLIPATTCSAQVPLT